MNVGRDLKFCGTVFSIKSFCEELFMIGAKIGCWGNLNVLITILIIIKEFLKMVK
jgi:hypothetical protein